MRPVAVLTLLLLALAVVFGAEMPTKRPVSDTHTILPEGVKYTRNLASGLVTVGAGMMNHLRDTFRLKTAKDAQPHEQQIRARPKWQAIAAQATSAAASTLSESHVLSSNTASTVSTSAVATHRLATNVATASATAATAAATTASSSSQLTVAAAASAASLALTATGIAVNATAAVSDAIAPPIPVDLIDGLPASPAVAGCSYSCSSCTGRHCSHGNQIS